jgi:hypothetical protein
MSRPDSRIYILQWEIERSGFTQLSNMVQLLNHFPALAIFLMRRSSRKTLIYPHPVILRERRGSACSRLNPVATVALLS